MPVVVDIASIGMAEAQGPGFVIRVYSCVKVTQEYDLIIARDPVDSG